MSKSIGTKAQLIGLRIFFYTGILSQNTESEPREHTTGFSIFIISFQQGSWRAFRLLCKDIFSSLFSHLPETVIIQEIIW